MEIESIDMKVIGCKLLFFTVTADINSPQPNGMFTQHSTAHSFLP